MKVKFFLTISLPQAKRELYCNLMRQIRDCVVEHSNLEEKFPAYTAQFFDAFQYVDDSIIESRKSLLTPEIKFLAEDRVRQYRLLRAAVKSFLDYRMVDQKDAAEFVWSLFGTHGDVPTMKVSEATGALYNLCQDLTEKYAEQVRILRLEAQATELKRTNDEYMRKYDERLHEFSTIESGQLVEARLACDDALENLLILVASAILLEGMEPYKHFVDFVNQAFKEAKIAMGSSVGSVDKPAEGEQEESTEEEQEEEEEEEEGNLPPNGQPSIKWLGPNGELLHTQYYNPGDHIVPPEPPAGYIWNYHPNYMPDHDLTIDCLLDE